MLDQPGPSAQLQTVLRSTFGFAELRPLQQQVIDSILLRKDVFVLMPTGGGKSLCYQLPAVIQPGVTVVVSPLIALMKDQVDRLRSLGVAATFINSSLDPMEARRRQAALAQGRLKLLYIAPERLALPGFADLLSRLDISLFAIDEAHCISEWGHDFRPDYRDLSRLRQMFPSTPIAAFTATATTRVQADIVSQLRLRDAARFKGNLDRSNLFYQVWPKKGGAYGRLLDYLSKRRDSSGIIYALSRNGTEDLAGRLQRDGFRAAAYHAGMEAGDRRTTQDAFISNDVRIVVATIAFGMGIDKPDIRFVIHYDLPKNLEGYYQETGRAGRDGQPSDAILFYSYADAAKQEYFIRQKESASERRIATEQLDAMVKWAEGTTCRRQALLRYFDETVAAKPARCCDICHPVRAVETDRSRTARPGQASSAQGEETDHTRPAKLLLSCARQTGETFGVVYLIRILVGSRDRRVLENGHNRHALYGQGKAWSRQEWRSIAEGLVERGYLRPGPDRFSGASVTPLGLQVLNGELKVSLPGALSAAPRQRETSQASVPARQSTAGDSALLTLDLFRQGMAPSDIASRRGMAPSTIEGHLAYAMEAGERLDISRLVTEEKRKAIEAVLRRLGPGPLKPVKDALGDDYSYAEIRYVRASLGKEAHSQG